MATDVKDIITRLDDIKLELDYIKEHMVDIDTILTGEDKKALQKARNEYKKGKTTSLAKLEKELGL